MNKQNYKVYIYINKINGKKYVGQTGNSLELRAGKNGYGYKKCIHFYNAIQKYGWENFEPYIIYDNLTKDEADKFEIQLISLLKTMDENYGYNITSGGSHTINPSLKVPVVQFDLEFNYIDRYDSMREAALQTGADASHIKRVCVHEYAQTNGFIWLFEADYNSGNYDKEYILSLINKEFKHPNSRPVVQCDLDMNFITQYKNISEASKKSGIRRSGINDNCTGRLKTCGGFIWMYKEDYEKIKNNKDIIVSNIKNANYKRHPVLQFDLDGNFIAQFSSILEASRCTKIDRKTITYVCKGRYSQAGGYIWEYALIA